jgi:cytochrome b
MKPDNMYTIRSQANHIDLDVDVDVDATANAGTTDRPILVWDLPVRLFHWMLVVAFAGAWLTAESERWRDVHVLLGYSLAGLIAFRLVWGVIGSRYARFGSFAAGPRSVWRYLRSLAGPQPEHHVGHNPAGGWAIFAIIGLALLTSVTGYMSYESIGGEFFAELHEGAATAMMLVAAVHVGGVLVSSVLHRENLVGAMFSGMKRGAPSDGIGRPRRIAGMLLLAGVVSFWVLAFRGDLPAGYAPGAQAQQVQRDHGTHGGR